MLKAGPKRANYVKKVPETVGSGTVFALSLSLSLSLSHR
jgi:hypothetical protein